MADRPAGYTITERPTMQARPEPLADEAQSEDSGIGFATDRLIQVGSRAGLALQ